MNRNTYSPTPDDAIFMQLSLSYSTNHNSMSESPDPPYATMGIINGAGSFGLLPVAEIDSRLVSNIWGNAGLQLCLS